MQLNTRRSFLKAAWAAGLAPMIIPRHGLGGPEAPSNTLRIGSIGVGRMGNGDMQEALKGATVVAVCDVDTKRGAAARATVLKLQGTKNEVAVYQDYRELLAHDDIDSVKLTSHNGSAGVKFIGEDGWITPTVKATTSSTPSFSGSGRHT